jgi:amino acid adenylation domain-containing protein
VTHSLRNTRRGGMPDPDGTPLLVGAGYSPGLRTRPGERLHEVFEERVDWMRSFAEPTHLAVDARAVTFTYPELDERANRLARYLLAQGARAGDRIGLLFDRAVYSYVAMLAVSKIHAAYVPLDVGFPPDRIQYIVSDARAHLVLTTFGVRERVDGLDDIAPQLLYLDVAAADIAGQAPSRLTGTERGAPVDDLAYLIYTSGTTGRPKGVAISHASICNFVRVAAEVYGIQSDDRVYQGMTIAFDFSVEEIWVPWMSGATLVPKSGGPSLVGLDLHEFLTEHHITAMCVVPTLLATIEEDLPELRFLLVSGEACPQDLILRWHRPGRRFLNVYGPTEATVTATWTTLDPDRAVTIGQPLPTYTAVILDPQDPSRALPFGEVGEIGLAGIGLAQGYLNRQDLTDKAFVLDVFGVPENPSGRVYRTGDLGRVNEAGEIEYHGRIDLQVKVRGYRIELPEIETVLMQVPGVAAAVVETFEPTPGAVELVGYYSLRRGLRELKPETIYHHLRERLPSYMVPAYLEPLAFIPMTTSDKVDRKALPAPASRRRTAGGTHVAPASETERLL